MFCTKCGTKINDDSRFCVNCGNKINYSVQTTNNNVITKEQMEMQIQMQQLKMQQQQLNIQAEQLRIQQQQFNSMIKCPKCGSTSISSNNKGYGVVKGGLGALALGTMTGGLGAVVGLGAGNIGRKKVICTCMNCGHKFKAGKR